MYWEISEEAMTLFTSSFRPVWIKCTVLLVLFAVLNVAARGPMKRRIRPQIDLQQNMVSLGKNATWLVLGDSHGLNIPFQDYGALNLSAGGDSYAEMRAKLLFAKREIPSIKYVVVPLDGHGFSTDRNFRNNSAEGVFWCTPEEYPKIYGRNYWKHRYLYSFFPLLNPNNARLTRRYIVHKLGLTKESKQHWKELTKDERRLLASRRFNMNFGRGLSTRQVEQFSALLEDAKTLGVKVVGVRFPVSPEYRQLVLSNPWRVSAEKAWQDRDILKIDLLGITIEVDQLRDQDHLIEYSNQARKVAREVIEESF